MPSEIDVRVGLPIPTGGLLDYVKHHNIPALASANAFYKHRVDGPGGFRKLPAGLYAGANVALDSAGFVALSRYRTYPWTLEAYIELAASQPWAWYASADMCVEPEIAADEYTVQMRIAGTVWNYFKLCSLANERGIAEPVPVLQGWTAKHYQWCADQMGLTQGGSQQPKLIGIGSMCRRHLNGPLGIVAIVEALDAILPSGVKFHLFGVKSAGLSALAGHPRLASIDSCAWDFGLRMDLPVGRTMDVRTAALHAWYLQQRVAMHTPSTRYIRLPPGSAVAAPLLDQTDGLAEMVMSGDVTYEDALWLGMNSPEGWRRAELRNSVQMLEAA